MTTSIPTHAHDDSSEYDAAVALLFTETEQILALHTASSPDTTVEQLERLAAGASTELRAAIAANPNTPAELLEKWKTDESLAVLTAVATNPSSSIDTLGFLMFDPIGEVRHLAQHTLERQLGAMS